MRRSLSGLSIIVFVILLNGCSSHDQGDHQKKEVAQSTIGHPLPYPVELIDQQGLHRLIHERHGKALLLNIWATWCQPCVEEFPDLIKLAKIDTLVEIVGISLDYPDEIHSKVTPFLEKLNVPFKVFIAKVEKQEDFIKAVDPTWSGAIPVTYIYDRNSRKQFSLVGSGTFELFEKKTKAITKK
jgi:thiol-disulfide isomerase/thioredoxin